ncbi:MAG: photosynthetic complex putative assembly protein PuhB [Pseudomonadota bacterium]
MLQEISLPRVMGGEDSVAREGSGAAAAQKTFRALPAELQPGERILWQGAPRWQSYALSVFHIRLIALYFAAFALWQGVSLSADGAPLGQALFAAGFAAAVGLPAIGIFAGIAWLVERTTVYTITTRRVLLGVGVALPKTFNVPFKGMEAASLRMGGNGTGNISIQLKEGTNIAYLLLWPHARPWRFKRAEPMLRAIPDAQRVARILADAIRLADAEPETTAAAADAIPDEALSQDDDAAQEWRNRARTRLPLKAILVLLFFCASLILVSRFSDVGTVHDAAAAPQAVYELQFKDLGGDKIAVIDAGTGEALTTMEPHDDGLLRGALRGMGRSRALAELPADAPFQLTRWDTGRVTLSDRLTGDEVPLDAFGPITSGGMADLVALLSARSESSAGRPGN